MAVAIPPVKVAAKAWTALVGAGILTLIQILQTVSPFLPGQWSWIATGVVGVLTSVAVFFVPNAITDEQAHTHLAKSGQQSATPWPTA